MLKKYTNKKEIAALFSVSTRTVERWCTRGLPCITIGANGTVRRFKLAAVEEWLEAQSEVEKPSTQPEAREASLDKMPPRRSKNKPSGKTTSSRHRFEKTMTRKGADRDVA